MGGHASSGGKTEDVYGLNTYHFTMPDSLYYNKS